MPLFRTPAALAFLALGFASCADRENLPPPQVMIQEVARPVPEAGKQKCASPVEKPDRDLTEEEVTNLWGRDRAELRKCEARRAAAAGD